MRPSKLASVDDAERDMLVQQLQEQISKATNSIRETQAILASRGSSRSAASAADVQAFLHKIQQLRAQLDIVLVSPHESS
jgi:hypothetical protein